MKAELGAVFRLNRMPEPALDIVIVSYRSRELLRDCLDAHIGVKASGGIRTAADVERMVSAGAVRVGTSAGAAIMKECLA